MYRLVTMANKSGGFDCDFVEKPPKQFQSKCPKCLFTLREPYQTTCCGYGFCQVCIEQLKSENKPCPSCKSEKFDCFEDKRLKRSLYEFKVYCSNKKRGCRWIGKLGELENHLNSNPTDVRQLEGCMAVQVNCLHCSKQFQRSIVNVHQQDQCPKRPFSCAHCKNFNSHYDDVASNHWPICGYYPVQCPNKCGKAPQRQNLKKHIANDCPLTVVDCSFMHVGCEVKLPRKDMPNHLTKSIGTHLKLQAESHKKLVTTLDEKKENLGELDHTQRIKKLTEGIKKLCNSTASHMSLNIESHEQLEAENKQLTTKCGKLQLENDQFKKQIATLMKDVQAIQISLIPSCPAEVTMTDFEQHKKDDDQWFSLPFYSHPKGYKMCLRVDANGHGQGKHTHISIYIHLMKGEFDDQLKWPFRGEVIVKLLNQKQDRGHHTGMVSLTDDTPGGRVTEGERAKDGWGSSHFISYTDLQAKYLMNDCLRARIKKVVLK